MPRRRLLAAAAATIALAGCGGDAESPLDEALGFLPADAPFAAAVSTDLDGEQYDRLGELVRRFPFGESVIDQLRASIEEEGVDFEEDVRPLLGNPFVVGTPDAESILGDEERFVAAIQTEDGDTLQELVERDSEEIGQAGGATIYRADDEDTVAGVKEDVLVLASSEDLLREALEQREGDDRLREEDFEDALEGLPEDAIARVYGDLEALIGDDPETEAARRVPWVASLRTLGATLTVQEEALALDLVLNTDPEGLSPQELPIATGAEPPEVVASEGEISIGIREASQIFTFARQAQQAVDAESAAQLRLVLRQIEEQVGVDVEELVRQFRGSTTVTVEPGGGFGVRAELADPDDFEESLARIARELPEIAAMAGVENLGVAREGDFFAASTPEGTAVVFGVVGDVFVLADDPDRAGRLASAEPEPVEGAQGSVVVRANAEQVANRILGRVGGIEGLGASLFTGPLGELSGFLHAEEDRLRGSFTLQIE